MVPTIIAVAITVTGLVYLVGSFDVVLGLGLSSLIDPLYGIAIGAESSPSRSGWSSRGAP